jgi:hypothetical protein
MPCLHQLTSPGEELMVEGNANGADIAAGSAEAAGMR